MVAMIDADLPATGLWVLFALPRSRSTALFRAMTAREEMLCIHEPFCSLADSGRAILPDGEGGEVDVTSAGAAAAHIAGLARRQRVFLKETTDNDLSPLVDHALCREAAHIAVLVRDPAPAIASHRAMRAQAGTADFGFGHLRRLMEALVAAGRPFDMLRAEELAADPEAALRRYCRTAGLPWLRAMLSWQPEDRPEWQRTRGWHAAVAESTGFVAAPPGPPAEAPAELVAAVADDHAAILRLGRRTVVAEGGCRCGALRYALTQSPRDLAVCHCTICRGTSGAPHLAWGTVDIDRFHLAGAGAQRYESSPGCVRTFCSTCGTQLTFFDENRPGEIDVTLASLDAPDAFAPEAALHAGNALAWDLPNDARRVYVAERTSVSGEAETDTSRDDD